METDNQIVRQLFETVQELQRMMSGLCRNDLLLIESFHGEGVSPEAIAVAAATVRATLYSLDALADRTRLFAEQVLDR
jgi:hypothetical protein